MKIEKKMKIEEMKVLIEKTKNIRIYVWIDFYKSYTKMSKLNFYKLVKNELLYHKSSHNKSKIHYYEDKKQLYIDCYTSNKIEY